MNELGKEHSETKMSRQFAARLARLKPKDRVHFIVMLVSGVATGNLGRRLSPAERQVTVNATRRLAEQGLDELDRLLDRFHGHRISSHPDALGAVAVEAPVEAIRALSDSKHVKAILEDQPIAPLPIAKYQ